MNKMPKRNHKKGVYKKALSKIWKHLYIHICLNTDKKAPCDAERKKLHESGEAPESDASSPHLKTAGENKWI
jgi:hypothetical protein